MKKTEKSMKTKRVINKENLELMHKQIKREKSILPMSCKKKQYDQGEILENLNPSEIAAVEHLCKIHKRIKLEISEEIIDKGDVCVKREIEQQSLPWSFVDVVKGINQAKDDQTVLVFKTQNLGTMEYKLTGSVGVSLSFTDKEEGSIDE